MADKTSREALLEMCTHMDVVRERILRSMQDELAVLKGRLQSEVAADEAEFSSHGRFYRWLNRYSHREHMKRRRPVECCTEKARFNLERWKGVMDDKPAIDDQFYLLNGCSEDFYVHNPPKSWRDPSGSYRVYSWFSEGIGPVDRFEDLNETPYWLVFLYGFTVKDMKVFHRGECTSTGYEDEGSDSSYVPNYCRPYTMYHPPTNDLLLTLEKIDQIPCSVKDNHEYTLHEKIDNRDWRIDPTEWKRFIGKRVEIRATSYNNHWENKPPRVELCWGVRRDEEETVYDNPLTLIKIVE